MTHGGGAADGDRVLEDIAQGLARNADSTAHTEDFAPKRKDAAPGELPDRTPGAHLEDAHTAPTGPGAVILDCGTSRHPDFTHVLLISPTAKDVLGQPRANGLGDVVGSIPGVEAFEWEATDHLHLRAPNMAHADLLREARTAVSQLLA